VAPVTEEAVKFKTEPTHTGPPLLTDGADGIALTTAVVLLAALVQPLTVTVKEYTPL